MDRPGVRKIPEGSGEQIKMEEIGCEVICCALTTLAVKGQVAVEMETQFCERQLVGLDVQNSQVSPSAGCRLQAL